MKERYILEGDGCKDAGGGGGGEVIANSNC